MKITRRSFVKKTSYGAAAVTVLGTGVGLAAGNSSTCTLLAKQEVEIKIFCQKGTFATKAAAKSAAEDEWGNNRVPVVDITNKDYKKPPNNPPKLPQSSGTSGIKIECRWEDDDTITKPGKKEDWELKTGFPQADAEDGIDDPDNHSDGVMPGTSDPAHVYTFTVKIFYAWVPK